MFRINTAADIMDLAASEPMVFELQLASGAGVPEVLAGRVFEFEIYDDARTTHFYQEALLGTDDAGDYARWVLDGRISEALYGQPGLLWDLSELGDNGGDVLASGRLNIRNAAPGKRDINAAPVSRYVTRIVRRWDPSPTNQPIYTVEVLPYVPLAPGGNSTAGQAMDFSDPQNSGYAAFF